MSARQSRRQFQPGVRHNRSDRDFFGTRRGALAFQMWSGTRAHAKAASEMSPRPGDAEFVQHGLTRNAALKSTTATLRMPREFTATT